MFNSPNNPSGAIYSEEEYRALGAVVKKYPDIYILSDEIYEHINYGTPHFSIAAIPELYDRTITVNGVAKAFAMTGWRIGYIGAAEWIARARNKMQGQMPPVQIALLKEQLLLQYRLQKAKYNIWWMNLILEEVLC